MEEKTVQTAAPEITGGAQLLNIRQAAELTGYRPAYIYKLVKAGKLRASKPFGSALVFVRSELIEDITRNGRGGK